MEFWRCLFLISLKNPTFFLSVALADLILLPAAWNQEHGLQFPLDRHVADRETNILVLNYALVLLYRNGKWEHLLFAIYWTATEYYFNQAFGDEPTFLITCFGFGIDNNIFAELSCANSTTSDSRLLLPLVVN